MYHRRLVSQSITKQIFDQEDQSSCHPNKHLDHHGWTEQELHGEEFHLQHVSWFSCCSTTASSHLARLRWYLVANECTKFSDELWKICPFNGTNLRYPWHLLAHTIDLRFQLFESLLIKSTKLLREHVSQFIKCQIEQLTSSVNSMASILSTWLRYQWVRVYHLVTDQTAPLDSE